MNEQKFWDWITSLNPIVIETDEEGNLDPLGIEELDKRIEDTVSEIRQANPSEEPND